MYVPWYVHMYYVRTYVRSCVLEHVVRVTSQNCLKQAHGCTGKYRGRIGTIKPYTEIWVLVTVALRSAFRWHESLSCHTKSPWMSSFACVVLARVHVTADLVAVSVVLEVVLTHVVGGANGVSVGGIVPTC